MDKNKLLNSLYDKKLYDKLQQIGLYKDWPLGIMHLLKTNEERQHIMNMLDCGVKNPNIISLKALEFRGVVGIPNEEFDGNPEDVINIDEA